MKLPEVEKLDRHLLDRHPGSPGWIATKSCWIARIATSAGSPPSCLDRHLQKKPKPKCCGSPPRSILDRHLDRHLDDGIAILVHRRTRADRIRTKTDLS